MGRRSSHGKSQSRRTPEARRAPARRAWIFLTLGLTSNLAPMAHEVGAERRMHLPLALVVLLVLPVGRGR